tara:strand:+ start:2401 stop:3219 length:819 start_codon:yes stop_codon:yes gene_type:complete
MKLVINTLIIFLLSVSFSYASKSKDLRKIEKMYDDGLLTRSECVKAKKKILGKSSSPTCKKTATKKSDNKDYSSQGTAFFIAKGGYLLTNYHVIEDCDANVKIKYNRETIDAEVISNDRHLDMSLLRASNIRNNKFLKLTSNEPEKLQRVIAVGYPFGKYVSDDLKFTSGIISALKGPDDSSTMIQVDAALNPGNSGGPIVDEANGDLVGVANMKLDASISEGTNFAIKSSTIENFLRANKIKTSTTYLSFGKSRDGLLKLLESTTVFVFCE